MEYRDVSARSQKGYQAALHRQFKTRWLANRITRAQLNADVTERDRTTMYLIDDGEESRDEKIWEDLPKVLNYKPLDHFIIYVHTAFAKYIHSFELSSHANLVPV